MQCFKFEMIRDFKVKQSEKMEDNNGNNFLINSISQFINNKD